ncbi:hypothetical protein BHUM_05151 [Candidatus Burkholderia humilis]|nr:hypothetical protein BHUM_05151 [Candidatus Burkholderia humilis]
MNRFAQTARRRIGAVSSTIVNASRHVIPQKLTSWKLALYLIVFLLPGGSFAVLGMGWFENRQRWRASSAAKKQHSVTRPLLPAPCSYPGNSGA